MNTTKTITLPQDANVFSPSKFFKRFFSADLAVDLGTANTLIYVKNQGIVINEPSLVAIDKKSREIIFVGQEAKEAIEESSKTLKAFRPLKEGVIADFTITISYIQRLLKKANQKFTFFKPRIVLGIPSGVTQVEKKAIIDVAMDCGASSVNLVEESMAAALGADLPIGNPEGQMIVDIGGGTTEVAVICLNQTVYSHSIRVAGDIMDEAIQKSLRKDFGIEISISEAERIKLLIGSALPFINQRTTPIHGKDLTNGQPGKFEISDKEIRNSLQDPLASIISSIKTAIEQCSPEIASDIINNGIYLAGGGSLLKGLSERLEREIGVNFYLTEDPLNCVAYGVGKIIDNFKEMKSLCIA
ncbi:UNVERIFIED_CONTAM: hypothetical protein GTU68_041752 [Idotea baltica]|nr:hypothetical protein [Idotea baltica]